MSSSAVAVWGLPVILMVVIHALPMGCPPSGEEADMASAHGQRGGRIGIIGALCLVDAPGSRAGDRITAVQDPQDPAMSLGFEAAQVLLGHSGQSARLIAGSGIDLGEALTASAGAVLIEEISDIHQAHADLIRSRCGGIAAAATNLHRSSAGGPGAYRLPHPPPDWRTGRWSSQIRRYSGR